MRLVKTVIVMLLALVVGAITNQASITLPFEDDFEGAASGDWVYPSIPASVTGDRSKSGNESLYSPDTARLPVETNRLWFNTWTIMNPVDLTGGENSVTNIGDDAAAFFLDTTGQVHAFSNNTYVVVKTGLDPSAWHRFSVQLDYDSRKWNLYHKGPSASADDQYNRLNNSPLAFNSDFDVGATESSEIEVSGETYLDDVFVDRSIFEIGATTPQYVSRVPLIRSDRGTGFALEYFGGSGTLDGPFGLVLETLYEVGTELSIWHGSALMQAELTSEGWAADDAILEKEITPGTGMFVDGTLTSATAVIPHGGALSGSTEIAGSDWSLLAVPHTAGTRSLSSLGLPENANDMVFAWTETGWSSSRFNGATWNPNLSLPPGRTFWLRTRGDGKSWTP